MAMRASGTDVPLDAAVYSIPAPSSFYRQVGKRTLDLTLSLVLLLIAAPLILALALAVGLASGFPPFYAATRVGKDGRTFRMWKLRTMVKDADAVLQRWLAERTPEGAAFARGYKLRDDPRVTRVGRILRKTSLDELPQLWNVVRGDMSLVGPRPIVAGELDEYGARRDAFLSLRPGITGLWQVEGRNAIDYPRRAEVELGYIGRVSLLEDIRLLAMTAPVVLLKRNGV